MKLFSKCNACHICRLYIEKRSYNVKQVGKITNKVEICNKCYRGIKETLKDQLING